MTVARQKPKSAMANFLDENSIAVSKENKLKPKKKNKVNRNLIEADGSLGEGIEDKILKINPSECVPWGYADRPLDEMGNIPELAKSMREFGQQQPVLLRKTSSTNSNKKYEVIFGNRRWRAAEHAGLELDAVIKEVSDQDASLYQKQENENRQDLSDYSRAKSYKAQIDGGVFTDEKALADYLGMSKQTLNDIMAFVRVPQILVDEIPNFPKVSIKMANMLAKFSKDNDVLKVLIELGQDISDKKITTSNLEKKIREYLSPGISIEKPKVYRSDARGKLLYQIVPKANGAVRVEIPKHFAKDLDLEMLNARLLELLESTKG